MMSDNDFYVCRQYGRESGAQFFELLAIDPPILARKSTGRVNARDSNLIVDIERLEVLGNEATEFVEHPKQPGEHIVQRHIVIAGDNDFGKWDRIQKIARFQKLLGMGPLRQVARDRHQVGLDPSDKIEQRTDDNRIGPAKVQIGKMDHDTHKWSVGTITLSAPGRDR